METLIISLIIVLILLILMLLYNSFGTVPKLHTKSVVIVDERGQHITNEREFVKFMEKIEIIFGNAKIEDIRIDDKFPRKKKSEAHNLIEQSLNELREWIKINDCPTTESYRLIDPLDEELENMRGENNHMAFNAIDSNKAYDGPRANITDVSTLMDIVGCIRQIKTVVPTITPDRRNPVHMKFTHKLLTSILQNYTDAITPDIFDDLSLSETLQNINPHSIMKLKCNRSDYQIVAPQRNNVIVDISGFKDDDRVGTAYKEFGQCGGSNENEQNSAIENMLVKKASTQPRLTGGRRHIRL